MRGAMESLRAFLITFSAGFLFFLAAALFLSVIARSMKKVRLSFVEHREKKLWGIMGAVWSVSVLPLMLPAMYVVSAGVERAESAVIVSTVFAVPLSVLVIKSLVCSLMTFLSGIRGK